MKKLKDSQYNKIALDMIDRGLDLEKETALNLPDYRAMSDYGLGREQMIRFVAPHAVLGSARMLYQVSDNEFVLYTASNSKQYDKYKEAFELLLALSYGRYELNKGHDVTVEIVKV